MSVAYQHSSLTVKYEITGIAWAFYIKYLDSVSAQLKKKNSISQQQETLF